LSSSMICFHCLVHSFDPHLKRLNNDLENTVRFVSHLYDGAVQLYSKEISPFLKKEVGVALELAEEITVETIYPVTIRKTWKYLGWALDKKLVHLKGYWLQVLLSKLEHIVNSNS